MTCSLAVLPSSSDGSYYTNAIASNYYIGEAKERGIWWGGLADKLSLSGEVNTKDFKSILSGLNPKNGKELLRTHEGRVPAVDIAFSVPKSLSATYVEADKTTRATIDDCCQEAVKEVLAFAQQNLLDT